MLRFIALSLAVHVLAITAWHNRDIQADTISGGRTLVLALLPSTASVTGGSLISPAEHNTLETARAAQQAAPPGYGKIHVPEKQQTMALPAARQQRRPIRTTQTTAAEPGTTVAATERVASVTAHPAPASTARSTENLPARHAVQTAVFSAFKANFHYPRIARRNGWEGTVILALRVLPDGQLTDILVSSSSGHPVLDRAAIHTLQTASVPQARQWLNEQAIDLVVPVEYRLLDS